jgi:hypothetical protein
MAEEDIFIGTQVAVDLDNGAALEGVVAAAKRAWGFNFVAPSIHHFHSTSRNARVVSVEWHGAWEHARRRAQLQSAVLAVPSPSEPEFNPPVVAPTA